MVFPPTEHLAVIASHLVNFVKRRLAATPGPLGLV
jgi:hypothetical protein